MAHEVNIGEWKAKERDNGSIAFNMENGERYVVDPPALWPDEVPELSARNDAAGLGRALMGDAYEAFKAAGGGGMMISAVVESVLRKSPGES